MLLQVIVLVMVAKAVVKYGGVCDGHGNDNKHTPNPDQILLCKELWTSIPDSAKSIISQHNHQYQANTAQQNNAGSIPKALWDQLPHMRKVLFAMHNAITSNKLTALQPNQMIIWIILPPTPYLCMPLIMYITQRLEWMHC